MKQNAFDLPHEPSHQQDDFCVVPANAAAYALVAGEANWAHHATLIVGPEGSGKTHLAEIFREASGAALLLHALLESADKDILPQVMALASCWVIEDVEALTESPQTEQALFHALNLAKEQGGRLLLTASAAPAELPFALPDLRSRLNACPVAHVAAPDDVLLKAVMLKMAADRQLVMSDAVLHYVLVRMERSFAAAHRVMEGLDRLSLQQGCNISLSVARQILAEEWA